MKKILAVILGITLAISSSIAFADDTTTISITKAGDSSAKVCQGSKCLGTVPVKFVDDATWDTAKDSYTVSPETANALSCKGSTLVVHGDGGITVAKAACKTKKESSKTPASK